MFTRLFGPKHTFKDALLILEKGLRSGEITLESVEDPEPPLTKRGPQIRSIPQDTRKIPEPR